MNTTPTQKQSETLTPCWYVKDFADGWIKFYDVDMAIAEAKASGAIMRYSENGAYPDRTQPSEMPVAEKDEQVKYACGCVSCLCNTADQCLGCGARSCKNFRGDTCHVPDRLLDQQAAPDVESVYTKDLSEEDFKAIMAVEIPHLAALLSFVRGMKLSPDPKDRGLHNDHIDGFNAACDTIIAEIEKIMKGGE